MTQQTHGATMARDQAAQGTVGMGAGTVWESNGHPHVRIRQTTVNANATGGGLIVEAQIPTQNGKLGDYQEVPYLPVWALGQLLADCGKLPGTKTNTGSDFTAPSRGGQRID